MNKHARAMVNQGEFMVDDIAQGDSSLLPTEILANMSHELRGPLTSIKGYAATLRRNQQRLSPEERHAFLQAIEDASDRLAILLDRFFELSQLEAGTLPFLPEPVSLVSLVQEAVHTAQDHLRANQRQDLAESSNQSPFILDLEHMSNLPASDEPLIWADRQHIHEVLNHLLENAILYAPSGSAVDIVLHPLQLSSERQQSIRPIHPTLLDGHRSAPLLSEKQNLSGFEICIRDHGIGIPDVHREHIFERFYRIDSRLIREVNGLGVGLTICKYIVEMHGGQIWVESEVGQGSTFHVWFPAYW
jgi:signal transduction histidine kinase